MSQNPSLIRVGVVGAGSFGSTFIGQARRVPRIAVSLICDRNVERAVTSLLTAGYGADDFVRCEDRAAIVAAVERCKVAVVEDVSLLADLPLDVVLEATGEPSVAANAAEMAIASGYGIAMATKETEVVVGPEIAHQARRAGVVHLPVEGDQPALLVSLINRARLLGLPVVSAGKSTESDFVYDPVTGTVTCWGRSIPVDGYDAVFDAGDDLRSRLPGRELAGVPVAPPPDLCEMTIVANHCGLAPSTAKLHAPIVRTTELAEVFCPRSAGGILEREGVVDVFGCLRRPDELSFAGGVFVTVEANDLEVGLLLASKGIPSSRNGKYLLLHNPVHLLGIEAIATVIAIADGVSSAGPAKQSYDLVARADRDLNVGETFELGDRHDIHHVSAEIRSAEPLGPGNAVPYYLVARSRVGRPISKGSLITGDDIVIDAPSALHRLRQSQDARGQLGADD